MTTVVNPGRMDKRMQFERYDPNAPRNSSGGIMPAVDETYVPIGSRVWVAIEPSQGSERLADKRLQAQQTHVIFTRTSSITAALRERDRGIFVDRFGVTRKYDIISVHDEDEDGRRTRIAAHYRREPVDT